MMDLNKIWWKIQEIIFFTGVGLLVVIATLLCIAFVGIIIFSPFIGIAALMLLGKKLFMS